MTARKSNSTHTQDPPSLTAEQLAEIDALKDALSATRTTRTGLTKGKRSKGPSEPRTFYDAPLLIKLAAKLDAETEAYGFEGDPILLPNWLDLANAYKAAGGKNSADWADDDPIYGPKLRTRLSQLANSDHPTIFLPLHFKPITPADQPLYFARREEAAILAKLAALGIDPDAPEAETAETETETAESAS